jgi:hypothetical protein
MENWQKDMEDKLNETHDMVKEMYGILVGSENYKEASVVTKMTNMEKRLFFLEADKIKRDATFKVVWIIAGVIGTALGSIITFVINHYSK